MKSTPRIVSAALLVFALTAADKVAIRYGEGAFQVVGWKASSEPAGGWASIFPVSVGQPSSGLPPLLGSYTVEDGTLTFRPRWPIAPGMHIVALFHPPGLLVLAEFDTPKQDAVPSARVEHIYPSTGDIPSNALRMYICFSAAMRRNEAWQHIHLLGENGARLELSLIHI